MNEWFWWKCTRKNYSLHSNPLIRFLNGVYFYNSIKYTKKDLIRELCDSLVPINKLEMLLFVSGGLPLDIEDIHK